MEGQSIEIVPDGCQTWDLIHKNFKLAIINMFKKLCKPHIKKKESMRAFSSNKSYH